MNESADNDGTSTAKPVFDRAYRINELNKIEKNITKLLRSAGEAIQALTLQSNGSMGQSDDPNLIEQRKELFSKAASEYFAALSYVDIHLRREIYALEEANIIPADIAKESAVSVQGDGANATATATGSGPGSGTGTGGMGNLDIGWLNSRNDKVGKDMQAELWAKAKDLLNGTNLDDLFKTLSGIDEPLVNGS